MSKRVKCECQGQLHPLVNNCLSCGRIVCQVEKEGPCLHCGNTVTKKGDYALDDSQFPDLDSKLAFNEALQHKNKLLDFNRKEIHQTSIVDDQLDYYQIADNVWESDTVRSHAVKRIIQTEEVPVQQEFHMELDLATRTFIPVKAPEVDSSHLREEAQQYVQNLPKPVKGDTRLDESEKCKEVYESLRSEHKQMKATTIVQPVKCCAVQNEDFYVAFQEEVKNQIQVKQSEQVGYDKEFYQLEDGRMCLSMHQPWAQLVIEGFKRIEGRMWGTKYRGPLWIHAGARKAEAEEISKVEYEYVQLYKDCKNAPQLPARYPTGALIGVVDFIGVVRRDTYEQKVRKAQQEEGDTEFKFVFRNPRKLAYPIKMRGQANVFNLDDEIRAIAQRQLQKVPTGWAQYLVGVEDVEEIEVDEVEEQQQQQTVDPELELKQQFSVKAQPVQKQQQQQPTPQQPPKVNRDGPHIEQNFGWSQVVCNVTPKQMLMQWCRVLEAQMGKPKGKKTHKVQIKAVFLPNLDQLCHQITKAVDRVTKYNDASVYYLRQDDKVFSTVGASIVVIGSPVQVQLEQQKVQVDQEHMMVIDTEEEVRISLLKEQVDGNIIKEIGQQFSYRTWLIIFQ